MCVCVCVCVCVCARAQSMGARVFECARVCANACVGTACVRVRACVCVCQSIFYVCSHRGDIRQKQKHIIIIYTNVKYPQDYEQSI